MNERVTEQTSPREGGPGPFQPRPQPTASKGPAGLPLPRVPCGLQPAPAPPGGPGTPTSPHKLIWMPVPLLQTALPPPPGPGSQTGARSPGVPMATGPDTNSLQPTVQSHILYANAPAGAGGSIPPHPVQTLPPHPQPLLSAPAWLPDPPHPMRPKRRVPWPHQQDVDHCGRPTGSLGASSDPPAGTCLQPPTRSRAHTPVHAVWL